MDYDFDTVKRLYDRYDIGFDAKTNTHYIADRKSGKYYSFEGLGAEKVKFAHYWVYATKYGKSTSTPNNDTTEEEYALAFSDNLREVYNTIIGTSIQHLQSTGRMCKVEALQNDLSSEVLYAHAKDVAEGLYAKPNGYLAFETWCKEVAKVYTPEEWIANNRSR